MERIGSSFLIAGVVTFFLGFFLQGMMPVLTLRHVAIATVSDVTREVTPEFAQLAEQIDRYVKAKAAAPA